MQNITRLTKKLLTKLLFSNKKICKNRARFEEKCKLFRYHCFFSLQLTQLNGLFSVCVSLFLTETIFELFTEL